jgi:hypothetical protein
MKQKQALFFGGPLLHSGGLRHAFLERENLPTLFIVPRSTGGGCLA